jgi:hypothetical protein
MKVKQFFILLAAVQFSCAPAAVASEKVAGVISDQVHNEGMRPESLTIATSSKDTVTVLVTKKTKAKTMGSNGIAKLEDLCNGERVTIDASRNKAGVLVADHIAWEPNVAFVPGDLANADPGSLAHLVLDPKGFDLLYVDWNLVPDYVTKIYVLPGTHHIWFVWGNNVEDRRYFSSNNDLGNTGAVHHQIEGWVSAGWHFVVKLIQKEDIAVAAGETRRLVADRAAAKPPAN